MSGEGEMLREDWMFGKMGYWRKREYWKKMQMLNSVTRSTAGNRESCNSRQQTLACCGWA